MKEVKYDLDQPLEKLLKLAENKFGRVEFQPVTIGDHTLELLQVKDMAKYIDKLMDQTRSGKKVDLPLWAKIWPACIFLGMFVSKVPLPGKGPILELGAGVGLIGLAVANATGRKVILSDIEDDALLFCRINILKNGLEDKVELLKADFTRSELDEKYDCIIGCEVLYTEAAYEPLAGFVNKHLSDAPEAEVILAMDQKRQGKVFFEALEKDFAIMRKGFAYKDEGQEKTVNIYKMKRK